MCISNMCIIARFLCVFCRHWINVGGVLSKVEEPVHVKPDQISVSPGVVGLFILMAGCGRKNTHSGTGLSIYGGPI